jgi:hypothetical protein
MEAILAPTVWLICSLVHGAAIHSSSLRMLGMCTSRLMDWTTPGGCGRTAAVELGNLASTMTFSSLLQIVRDGSLIECVVLSRFHIVIIAFFCLMFVLFYLYFSTAL